MRSINEYLNTVQTKYKEDHDITGISIRECVDIVVDNAFFADEICYQIIDPLKEKLLNILLKQKKDLTTH